MKILAIAQHQDILRYSTICGSGYWPSIQRFEPKDYVYMQHTTLTTLDVTAIHVLFYVCGRFYPLECCCWRVNMVRHGRTMCIIMCHVIFPMWMAKLTHP
jgi:hypothetical protein